MSTKTSFKRVALVAVAALGMGVLTSVAPANAAMTVAPTLTTLSHAGTATTPLIQGTAFTSDITVTTGTDAMAIGETLITTFVLTDPVGNVVNNATFTKAAANIGDNGVVTQSTATAGQSTGQVITVTATGGTVAAAAYVIGTIGFTPTMGGNYALTSTTTGTAPDGTKTEMDGTTSAARGLLYTQGISVTQGTTRGAAGGAVVGNQAQVRITYPEAEGTTYKAVSTGVGAILGATPTDAVNTNISGVSTDFSKGLTTVTTTNVTAHNNVLTLASTVAGDQTITVTTVNTTTGIGTALYSIVVTWGAASAVSTQYSLVKLLAGAVSTDVNSSTADTAGTTVSSAAGTQYFTIEVETNDQNNVAMAGFTLGASISGPGLIGISAARNATTATGRSLTVAQATGNAFGSVSVWGDGSAGPATITISATNSLGVTTVLGTKTVTFVGAVSKATVTQNLFVAKAATQLGVSPTTTLGAATSVATTAALKAVVTDAAGVRVVSGSTVKLVSSNTAVITAGACAELTTDGTTTADTTPTAGVFECSVSGASGALSGQSATITFQVLNPATGLYDIVATPITFKIGGAIASVVVALDKASYAPGAAINLTATAKDSAGNAAYDGQAAIGSIAANMTAGGALPVAAETEIVDGSFSTTGTSASLFAPASTGSLVISGKTVATATDVAGKAYSVTATVASADNAALTTLINSLIKKLNALATLVAKIQKKLGVK